MKVRDLSAEDLNYWVSKVESQKEVKDYYNDWSLGGPIIEREKIAIWPEDHKWLGKYWVAKYRDDKHLNDNQISSIDDTHKEQKYRFTHIVDDTPLPAAMKCYLERELGYCVPKK